MHNTQDPRNTLDENILASSDLIGRECCCCFRILDLKHFRADHTNRDGRSERCNECESTPWLSIEENTARLREQNYNSEALKKQRPPYVDSMRCDIGRIGRVMDSKIFLEKLKTLIPGLRWYPGNIEGDISVYVQDNSQPSGLKYLWYIPEGVIPEFSLHEFDERGVPVKEKMRGWRTPLLRVILSDMITESQANQIFGRACENLASEVWNRRLFAKRNNLPTV